jgi:hypothetical protein
MELNRLQKELDERERVVGRKLSQLKKRGALKDKFILEAMKEELEALVDCERRIETALREIQGFTIFELQGSTSETTAAEGEEGASELDSFDVS